MLALTVIIGSAYLLALPSFAQAVLEFVLAGVDDIRAGSLISSLALMFFPVTFLGMYSPFAIRLLLRSAQRSGRVSGAVYGVSTAGSIVGTLGTTFFLIPAIGSRAITLTLGALGLVAGSALLVLARRSAAPAPPSSSLRWPRRRPPPAGRTSLIDEGVRAAMLKRADGRIAHIETEYNDVFITKRGNQLMMSFQLKGWDYTELVSNLADPRRPAAALRAGDDGRDRLSRGAAENPDARARRRLDLDLSRRASCRRLRSPRWRSIPA